jgi:hypothetical protein
MLGWLRKRLRRWLLDPADDDPFIEVADRDGRVRRMQAVGAVGLRLVCKPVGDRGLSQTMVAEGDVTNREKFWRLWKRFSSHQNLRWESGEDFEPGA